MKIEKIIEDALSNSAKTAIDRINNIYDEYGENPCFFPEYTIHGRKHIEKVLSYAARIIDFDSMQVLKSNKSIDILVLGICLHDLGMFISKEGFCYLLKDLMWNLRFEEFIKKLRRASGIELDRIYGAVVKNDPMRDEVEKRRQNMFESSNIFTVGEFIRRHHHELAHYIAIKGFPASDSFLKLLENDGYENLIGYVAKAHRGSIRKIMEEIGTNKYQNYSPRNIPIAFLMAVIWVADEIDDKNYYRAPRTRENLHGIIGSYSQQQWVDNRCVFEPTLNADMSLIYVDAAPSSTSQYLRIDEYCKKVQTALDNSWAILAEYYGKQYGLTIHRVNSSIYENKARFNFMTTDASLRVNPTVVKLLVKPLYDNNPCYGVRELLSNAIDACHEREILDLSYTGKAVIICNLDAFSETFSITDNGIGMTEEVIVNYFMNVGASFRDSDIWKRDFIKEDGSGKVKRYGRFGIGVLAAFLLGNEVEVTTRHWQDQSGYGYHFKVRLDGTCPDVERIKCVYGTTISIKVPELIYHDKTTYSGILFSEYVKYKYGIPHYSFEYPLCLYRVSDSNGSISIDEVYYYNSSKIQEVKHCPDYELRIGSMLNTGHFKYYYNDDKYNDAHKNLFVDETNEEMWGSVFVDFTNSSSRSSNGTRTINPTLINNFTCAKVKKMFYNGMAVRLADLTGNDLISDKNCMPLYVDIKDMNFVTSLNLKKADVLDCYVRESILRFHGFLLIMYPLTLDSDLIFDLLKKFPYDDKVKREISAPTREKVGEMEYDLPFVQLPLLSSDEFVFAYDIDYYLSKKKQGFGTWYMYDAIIEWLEVAHGYEQNYEIPYDIEERKCKFKKAFLELAKYLSI